MSDNYLKALAKAFEANKSEEEKKKDGGSVSVTRHSLKLDDETIGFTATAGYMQMTDEDKNPKCNIFYVSYIKDNEPDRAKRPITFAFNGGPGCASIWLHFAVLGPKIAVLTEEGMTPKPPYKFEDNKYSWLKFTDLVIIDPVGTGFSRPVKDEDPKQFYGVQEDIQWVGDFIRLYTSKNKRWVSPKFIAGESYGTTRACGLAGYLQGKYSMDLNGVVLVSSVLSFQTISFETGNDLPYPLILPGYTATAYYHNKLAPELMENLEKTLKEAEEFAQGEYTLALMAGDAIDEEKKEAMAEKIAYYTGLSKKFVSHSNLRIPCHRFCKELLREDNRTVGRLDSRFKGIDADSAGEYAEYDPSFSKGPFVTAVNDYVRTYLKYENDLPYMPMAEHAHMMWNWSGGLRMGYFNVGETLRNQMCENPHLRAFIACGYYDLATPYFAAKYTANHLGLDKTLRDNVVLEYYESGHMIYYHKPSLVKLRDDVAKFYQDSY
ncbi:MAG: peptidase S10 [Firmicutes bacterium]|nr:peptidase S10 [Bacillota bacterium]